MENKKHKIFEILQLMLNPKFEISGEDEMILISIKNLDLSHCKLEKISKIFLNKTLSIFDHFPNLLILDLSYNKLSVLTANCFKNVKFLQHLDLSNNIIEKSNNFKCLNKLTNLKYLNISENLIYDFKHNDLLILLKPAKFYLMKELNFLMKNYNSKYNITKKDIIIIQHLYPNLAKLNNVNISESNQNIKNNINKKNKLLNNPKIQDLFCIQKSNPQLKKYKKINFDNTKKSKIIDNNYNNKYDFKSDNKLITKKKEQDKSCNNILKENKNIDNKDYDNNNSKKEDAYNIFSFKKKSEEYNKIDYI